MYCIYDCFFKSHLGAYKRKFLRLVPKITCTAPIHLANTIWQHFCKLPIESGLWSWSLYLNSAGSPTRVQELHLFKTCGSSASGCRKPNNHHFWVHQQFPGRLEQADGICLPWRWRSGAASADLPWHHPKCAYAQSDLGYKSTLPGSNDWCCSLQKLSCHGFCSKGNWYVGT